jgi:hypothetical protein
MAESHFADQMLEAVAVISAGAGNAQVCVDRVNAVYRPTEGNRSLTQSVLALATLGVLEYLTLRGLADIQECVASQMVGADLLMRINMHASPPSVFATPCWPGHSRVCDRPASLVVG